MRPCERCGGTDPQHVCLPVRWLRIGSPLPPVRGDFAAQMRDYPFSWRKP